MKFDKPKRGKGEVATYISKKNNAKYKIWMDGHKIWRLSIDEKVLPVTYEYRSRVIKAIKQHEMNDITGRLKTVVNNLPCDVQKEFLREFTKLAKQARLL